MTKKRTYSTVHVESVDVAAFSASLSDGCIVSLDVAKTKFVGAVATARGEVLKLFRFEHPHETPKFLELVSKLTLASGSVRVAMEPTGTYGDAIRYQLDRAGLPVWMVSPKKTHDSQSLFDGVPSMHDPKSAVHIARLCALALATEWKMPSEATRALRALVDLRGHEFAHEERCFGRIEAMLARHWPELGRHLDVRAQKSALALLEGFSSPRAVAKDPTGADELLTKVSRSRLPREAIDGVLQAARSSLGVPMTDPEAMALADLARHAMRARSRAEVLERQMSDFGSGDATFVRLEAFLGTFTAAAVLAMCDPRRYGTPRQLEKACGLNLREKSSGEDDRARVRVSITKRGPGLVRKLLYLFALRMIQQHAEVRAWYMRRRSFAANRKLPAVMAVMRKLVRAIFHVAKGADFDPKRLFDTRRFEVPIRDSRALRRSRSAAPQGAMA